MIQTDARTHSGAWNLVLFICRRAVVRNKSQYSPKCPDNVLLVVGVGLAPSQTLRSTVSALLKGSHSQQKYFHIFSSLNGISQS